MTTPGQNSEILDRLDSFERHLGGRMSRLEVAMMGDEGMGNPGFKGRLQHLETLAAEAPSVHDQAAQVARADLQEVAEDASAGRKKLWDSVRELQGSLHKLTNRWYLQVGLMVGSGGVGAGLYDLMRNSGG